jgi:tetratricopeptide (TPR) repeat protein
MRNILILFLFVLFSFNGFAQTKVDELNILIINNKYTEALEFSVELINKNPDNAQYYYQQSIVLKLLFKFPQAINSITKALELDSLNNVYLTEYGILLAKKDRDKEAAKIFENVLSAEPNHIYSGIWLSNYYMKEKEFEKASSILLNLYSNDTSNGYFARNIGLCNIRLKEKRGAIKWLQKAIQLDSTDIKSYEYISRVYTAIEQFDLAIEYLNIAVKIDPSKELYVQIGDIYVMRNHNFRAIPAYLKAYDIDHDDEFLAKSIGVCYFRIKKFKKAKLYLDIAKLELVDLQIFQHLAYIHSEMGQIDSSTYYYKEALKLLQTDNRSIFSVKESIAKNYYALYDFHKAVEMYSEALELDLNDDFWNTYDKNRVIVDVAAIYVDKLADKLKAIEYYEKVIEPEITINKNYYTYAQQQITKLKEELFFEGKY